MGIKPGRAIQKAAARNSGERADRRPGLRGPLFNALSQYARQVQIPPDWSKSWPSEGNATAKQGLHYCFPVASNLTPDAYIPSHVFASILNPTSCTVSNNRCTIIAWRRLACRWFTPQTETDKIAWKRQKVATRIEANRSGARSWVRRRANTTERSSSIVGGEAK